MEFPLYNQQAENVGNVQLSDKIFGLPANNDLVYQVVTAQMANRRQIVAHAKGRGEVRGGGKKPWRQKGTGRARHGSIRSPIWKGGGVTHGPSKEKVYAKDLNKKMVRKALKVALSDKVRAGHLVVIDTIALENNKTKEMAAMMNKFKTALGSLNSILLVTPDQAIYKAARNLPYVDTVEAQNLNPLSILSSTYVFMPKSALESVEKQWSK
ncbi:MAG TPA: 50S ribosomal protein L4 [Candidatus Paceibacterota bacterium]|nr:50S ribosomal protein L4 [Candidatus Paceibacterota bacterium]